MEQWIFWFDELDKAHNDIVGKKCAHLGELIRLGLNVPWGFAISVKGFEEFMRTTGADEELKDGMASARDEGKKVEACHRASRIARNIIESKQMPEAMDNEIRAHYRELCCRSGRQNMAVAVRSSGSRSMPGQMETYLNVEGENAVLTHIKKVWGSSYSPAAIAFRAGHDLPLEWAPIGVAIMTLVDAKAAGVALTVEPTTGDATKVVIEGNWGLGESVVGGVITPDSFTVDKESMEIIERRITRKTSMVVRGPWGTRYKDTPHDLQERPCINDEEIREIVRVAIQVEQHFGVAQDMEWVVDGLLPPGEDVFWLQARPAGYAKMDKADEMDYLIDLMVRLFK